MSHHATHNRPHPSKHSVGDPMSESFAADTRTSTPSADRIRLRAYEISQARHGGPGNALTDWVQAEQELHAGEGAKR